MRTMFYFCLLVAAAGFHGLEAMGPPPRPSGGPPRPSGRPPGPPGPPGNKGTTADYGWTDDDYDENEGWVSCGCHDAPSCRKCGTQQHLCNGDCSWSYGGCYRKGPRPTNPGPRPTRPPHPPTGETPVSMPSRPPPTWETPVSIPGSRPPPTYETPVHIGSSTPGPGGNGTSTEDSETPEKVSSALESFINDRNQEYGNLGMTNFSEKIQWIHQDIQEYIGNDVDLSSNTLPVNSHISNKTLEVWNVLKNNADHSQVNTELDKIKDNIDDSEGKLCPFLIETARTISKIFRSNTNGGLNGFDTMWQALVNNTELQNSPCPICNSPEFEVAFTLLYQNVTLGVIHGYNLDMGLTGATNGTQSAVSYKFFAFTKNNPFFPVGKPCFSGAGLVETKSGQKYISDLIIGDFVRTSSGGPDTYYTKFIGWMTREKSAVTKMLKIFTSQGSSSLTLTDNHIVFTSNSTKYADQLRPGDFLKYFNGSMIVNEMVTEIKNTIETGYWAPLTRDGSLFVDGYLASCYASFPHWISDLAMTPVKALPTILLDDEESQHKDGPRSVINMMKNFGGWIGARERNYLANEYPSTPLREIPHNSFFVDKSEF